MPRRLKSRKRGISSYYHRGVARGNIFEETEDYEKFLEVPFRYIEQNPIKEKMTKGVGEYRWASSALILENDYAYLFENSLLLKKEIFSILHRELNEKDYLLYDEFQKIVYQKREDEIVRLKQKSLDEILGEYDSKKERNRKILEAVADGYKMGEIARYLGLSSAGVSYVVRRLKIQNIEGFSYWGLTSKVNLTT